MIELYWYLAWNIKKKLNAEIGGVQMDFVRAIMYPLGIFMALIFVLYSIKWLSEFIREYRFLKTQVARCGTLTEKRRWEKILFRFYIRKIPFIGFIISKFM